MHPEAPGDLLLLLEAARGGDEQAFGQIYRRFARVVHGLLVARSGSEDAEDLTQEVFSLVHRGLDGVREAEALPSWICTVARNVARDHLRRLHRGPRRAELARGGRAGSRYSARASPWTPLAFARAGELARRGLTDVAAAPRDDGGRYLRERVLARIRELPDAYRETLVLRLVEGLSGPEIAGRTGLTHGSVRVNLTRGMALLRPLLAQEGWP